MRRHTLGTTSSGELPGARECTSPQAGQQGSSAASSECIYVACRVRPLVSNESRSSQDVCISSSSDSRSVEIIGGDRCGDGQSKNTFGFDSVFGQDSAQEDVFSGICERVLRGVLNGFNGTILCYGQTASGKTWTMEGTRTGEGRGIIPRSFELLFDCLVAAPSYMEFTVRASMVEIYLERISDLLDASGRQGNLAIKEHPLRGPCVDGASEPSVASVEELQECLEFGAKNRAVGCTKMNERSSRSHSVFSVHVQTTDTRTASSSLATLHLVDLAGSEKIKQTQASGQTLEEAKKINLSLSALGNVINALSSGRKGHVPYRDSKLTRILQESLGGNSNTALIVTVSPSSLNAQESLTTLRFGQRAKHVKNTPHANRNLSQQELERIVKEKDLEIARLTSLLASANAMDKRPDEQNELPIPSMFAAKCESAVSIASLSTQAESSSQLLTASSSELFSMSEEPHGASSRSTNLLALAPLLRELQAALDCDAVLYGSERVKNCADSVLAALGPLSALPALSGDVEDGEDEFEGFSPQTVDECLDSRLAVVDDDTASTGTAVDLKEVTPSILDEEESDRSREDSVDWTPVPETADVEGHDRRTEDLMRAFCTRGGVVFSKKTNAVQGQQARVARTVRGQGETGMNMGLKNAAEGARKSFRSLVTFFQPGTSS